jgi:hypothetical protein
MLLLKVLLGMVKLEITREKSHVIKAHGCIGAVTRTVLATSMHENRVDPESGVWQVKDL